MDSKEIRTAFLNFFKDKQHMIVPSAPIVLKDDPTLMFTNSGMNQFKDFFLGYKKPIAARIADTQKCLRVSGKHNDLDDVGKDTYHHTMFEMLGNWSFGDYFKEEAIEWAWELLTEVYKIPKDILYVTVFEGDEKDGTSQDTEAFNIWKKYISEDRILLCDKSDNFWEMGEVGPCGPCSEIHVDIRSLEEKAKIDGKDLVNKDHPQVVEIWNLVFMEFQRKANGTLESLPQKHIDTGMGFERLAMVLQGKESNYDTDVFTPLIEKLEEISDKKYGENEKEDIAIRVVVDHVRAIAFAIADGQLPSNTGAGYVIRRILRRAIGYGFRFLDLHKPFMYKLFPVLKEQMGMFFPELSKESSIIEGVIREEETNFFRTLELGINRLSQIMAQHTSEEKMLVGNVIFEMYDTYGFPTDLSQIMAEEQGFAIDQAGFEVEMQKQKERSKKATAITTDDWVVLDDAAAEDFVGYDKLETNVFIMRYRKIKSKKNEFYQIVLNQSPFYAESGGQIGDSGVLVGNGESIKVLDTKKENNLNVHIIEELPTNLSQTFEAKVNVHKRKEIEKNHTATHLLHEALRDVLGKHVEQKGSYVGESHLRFDFSHYAKLTEEEVEKVESLVNEKIGEALPLNEYRSVKYEEAIELGAMALFGEKYGDKVRVIRFGTSLELCGGTHVANTADIRLFQITSESSIASGIRRIEAITSQKAIDSLKETQKDYNSILTLFKTKDSPLKSIEVLLNDNSNLKKQLEQFILQQAQAEKVNWKNALEDINGIHFLAVRTSLDANSVKQIALALRKEVENLFLVVASDAEKKPTITVAISDELVASKNLDAAKIVRELAKDIQGGGGGQAFLATAGGSKLEGIDAVLNKAKNFIA